jgi:hypothetical protein
VQPAGTAIGGGSGTLLTWARSPGLYADLQQAGLRRVALDGDGEAAGRVGVDAGLRPVALDGDGEAAGRVAMQAGSRGFEGSWTDSELVKGSPKS